MDMIWSNEYVYIAAYCSVVILCTIVFLAVFELVTKLDGNKKWKYGSGNGDGWKDIGYR